MLVTDIFRTNDILVFAGVLETDSKCIQNVKSRLLVDGDHMADLVIEGEALGTHSRARDLWNRDKVDLDKKMLGKQEVVLVSP